MQPIIDARNLLAISCNASDATFAADPELDQIKADMDALAAVMDVSANQEASGVDAQAAAEAESTAATPVTFHVSHKEWESRVTAKAPFLHDGFQVRLVGQDYIHWYAL
jgi:hypothetical protein